MDITRLRNDLRLLTKYKQLGLIRDVDWNIDGLDNWITIFGALKLPQEIFNLTELNIKLPVPASLYEPTSKGRYSFYNVILVDSKIRTRTQNGWETIARQFNHMYPDEVRRGWNFLCVLPHDVRKENDIRSIFPLLQLWSLENGDEGR